VEICFFFSSNAFAKKQVFLSGAKDRRNWVRNNEVGKGRRGRKWGVWKSGLENP